MFDSKLVPHAFQLVFRTTGGIVKVSHSGTHWSEMDGVVMGGETPSQERNSRSREKHQIKRNSKSRETPSRRNSKSEKFQVGEIPSPERNSKSEENLIL